MAYFANGVEQLAFQESYCDRCVHDAGKEPEDGCRLLALVMVHNYRQLDDTPRGRALKEVHDVLMPIYGVVNTCAMFVPTEGR